MVGDHHVIGRRVPGGSCNGLPGDGLGGVEGEEDRTHGRGRVADDEADAVPRLGRRRRIPGFHEGHDVADAPRLLS